MRQAEAERRQAVLLDAGHLAEGARRARRAGTPDRSRNRRCRAAARPACRRRAPRPLRDDRRARRRTARKRNAPCACPGVVAPRSCNSRSIRVIAAVKSLVSAGPARRVDPGRAVERIDHEAGIVGEGRKPGGLRRGDRLDPRRWRERCCRSLRARRGRVRRPTPPRRRRAPAVRASRRACRDCGSRSRALPVILAVHAPSAIGLTPRPSSASPPAARRPCAPAPSAPGTRPARTASSRRCPASR